MTANQVAALQNPLIATAEPISAVGIKRMTHLYESIALDTPNHVIDVYVTNVAKAGQLLRAAKRQDPGLDLRLVRVRKAAFSLAALTAATNRLASAILAKRIPFRIYSIDQPVNGMGLRLEVANPVGAGRLAAMPVTRLGRESLRQFAGVAVTFTHGTAMAPASREDDSAPFIGGDYTFGWNSVEKGRPFCSAGIPVENSSNQDGLVEAGHCFTPNNGVYTEFFNASIGTASGIVGSDDAEIIWTGQFNGAGSNADEGESDGCSGICYHALVATGDPFNGEFVCQDGISSFLDGRGVPCNIRVEDPSTYQLCVADGTCPMVHGIHSQSNNGNPIARAGDSGAVVFTIHSSSTRNAIGMVDALVSGCGENCTLMSFVPQGSIMLDLHVHLNPHQ